MNLSHVYDDDELYTASAITVTLVDEDGVFANAGLLNFDVLNVAPTGTAINGGAVNEGSNGLVLVVGQSDPSSNDVSQGFTYGYDFNNDGDFSDPGEITSTASSSAVVPASYLADDPNRTVRIEIRDNDGGVTSLFTTITVNNVAPVVSAGADANAFAGVSFVRNVTFTDPGADANWDVSVDWNGDLTFDDTFSVPAHSFNINHTYAVVDIGQTYTVTVQVDDHDGGISTDTFDVTVIDDTFRVTDFQTNPSGFDVTFNRSPDLADLNLYSGLPGGFDPADVTLVGAGTARSMVRSSGTPRPTRSASSRRAACSPPTPTRPRC